MGRPKKYDREVALVAAMNTFWKVGFSGTSMRMLSEATGMSLKALYAEFGDKEQIFQTVVEGYSSRQTSFYAKLEKEPYGLEQLRAHFEQYKFENNFLGCLLVNTLAENATVASQALVTIDRFFQSVQTRFEKHLMFAQNKGDISSKVSTMCLAQALVVFDQGLAIAGKSESQRPSLLSSVEALFSALTAQNS